MLAVYNLVVLSVELLDGIPSTHFEVCDLDCNPDRRYKRHLKACKEAHAAQYTNGTTNGRAVLTEAQVKSFLPDNVVRCLQNCCRLPVTLAD